MTTSSTILLMITGLSIGVAGSDVNDIEPETPQKEAHIQFIEQKPILIQTTITTNNLTEINHQISKQTTPEEFEEIIKLAEAAGIHMSYHVVFKQKKLKQLNLVMDIIDDNGRIPRIKCLS